MPEAIPYRTTYYDRTWGFCLSAETLDEMDESDTYEVYIDSSLDPDGSLTYAEATIEGDSDREYLLSTYCCHPSLANDNLSGPILATLLFERLRQADPYHSYRLVIAPETIGILSYLHENEAAMTAVDGGYVVTTVAGPGQFGYKESFHGDHEVDTAARLALADDEFIEYPFRPTGSDERQYSSPGFRIPTGTITKDKYYEYDQYHTSADDLEFVSAVALKASFERYWDAIRYLEMNRTYERVHPYGEFKLDAHDLYPSTGGGQRQPAAGDDDTVLADVDASASNDEILSAIEWLMFGCDGSRSLFELAEQSGLAVETLFTAAEEMETKDLLSAGRHD
jgi:aminopeptidase-like protein